MFVYRSVKQLLVRLSNMFNFVHIQYIHVIYTHHSINNFINYYCKIQSCINMYLVTVQVMCSSHVLSIATASSVSCVCVWVCGGGGTM